MGDEQEVFNATASATASAIIPFTQTIVTATSSASANGSTYEEAYNQALFLAQDYAKQTAQYNANMMNQTLSLASTNRTGVTGPTGSPGSESLGSSYWIGVTGPTGIYYNSGNVGIGLTSPQHTLDVNGNANITEDIKVNELTIGKGGGDIDTNTALGVQALYNNTEGTGNVAVGFSAGSNNTIGYNNTYLGSNTTTSDTSFNNSTALGYNSTITDYNQVTLGTAAEKIYIPGSYLGIGNYNITINTSVLPTNYNPYAPSSVSNFDYYLYSNPGNYTFINVSSYVLVIYYLIGGGGGNGGTGGSDASADDTGGGGGGNGGIYNSSLSLNPGEKVNIIVGGPQQDSSISTNEITITAGAGGFGGNAGEGDGSVGGSSGIISVYENGITTYPVSLNIGQGGGGGTNPLNYSRDGSAALIDYICLGDNITTTIPIGGCGGGGGNEASGFTAAGNGGGGGGGASQNSTTFVYSAGTGFNGYDGTDSTSIGGDGGSGYNYGINNGGGCGGGGGGGRSNDAYAAGGIGGNGIVMIYLTSYKKYNLDVNGNGSFTQDIEVNDLTIGKGGGNIDTNTALGVEALASNTTGYNNVAIGYSAGSNNTSFNNSTALGYNSTITDNNQVTLGTADEKVYIPGSYLGINTYNPYKYKELLDAPGSEISYTNPYAPGSAVTGFTYYLYSTPGTYTLTMKQSNTLYYLIGGSGGNGADSGKYDYEIGGGGGAGGIYHSSIELYSGTYTITVGEDSTILEGNGINITATKGFNGNITGGGSSGYVTINEAQVVASTASGGAGSQATYGDPGASPSYIRFYDGLTATRPIGGGGGGGCWYDNAGNGGGGGGGSVQENAGTGTNGYNGSDNDGGAGYSFGTYGSKYGGGCAGGGGSGYLSSGGTGGNGVFMIYTNYNYLYPYLVDISGNVNVSNFITTSNIETENTNISNNLYIKKPITLGYTSLPTFASNQIGYIVEGELTNQTISNLLKYLN